MSPNRQTNPLFTVETVPCVARQDRFPLTSSHSKKAPMSRRYDGYIIAVIATLTATMVRFAVAPLVGDRAHFFTYLIAVLVTARYGGFKPGVLAGFLGGLLGVYFFVPPPYS